MREIVAGYYWVWSNSQGKWIVAEWDGHFWTTCGCKSQRTMDAYTITHSLKDKPVHDPITGEDLPVKTQEKEMVGSITVGSSITEVDLLSGV